VGTTPSIPSAGGPPPSNSPGSLPYHFGNADGRRECPEAVRGSAGLVAVEGDRVAGRLLLALTVSSLWPGNKALLLAMPL
jgi:hypothetical protein